MKRHLNEHMTEVERYIDELVKYFKYKPLANDMSINVKDYFNKHIKPVLSITGAEEPLYDKRGTQICKRYNRIVVGDYGAYIEFEQGDIYPQNIKVKTGEEYRFNTKRYPYIKYYWYTLKGEREDTKLYLQVNTVKYADYVPGKFYVSTESVYTKAEIAVKKGTRKERRARVNGESDGRI